MLIGMKKGCWKKTDSGSDSGGYSIGWNQTTLNLYALRAFLGMEKRKIKMTRMCGRYEFPWAREDISERTDFQPYCAVNKVQNRISHSPKISSVIGHRNYLWNSIMSIAKSGCWIIHLLTGENDLHVVKLSLPNSNNESAHMVEHEWGLAFQSHASYTQMSCIPIQLSVTCSCIECVVHSRI